MSVLKNQPFTRRVRNAAAGIAHALSGERSLRLQGLALLGVLATLAVLQPGAVWFALVLVAGGSVLSAELMNTALEALSDAAVPEYSPHIAIAKDVAAGAVLLASLGAVAVGLLVFVPHLAARLAVAS